MQSTGFYSIKEHKDAHVIGHSYVHSAAQPKKAAQAEMTITSKA